MIPFSETSSKPLTKGDVCLAYWTNDECYYDGTVLKRNRSNIIIQLQKDKTSCTVEKNIKTRRDIIPGILQKVEMCLTDMYGQCMYTFFFCFL